jgi:hypothetical protein
MGETKEYFYNKEMNDFNEKDIKFKKHSTWTPEKGRDKWLDTYIEEIKDDVLNVLHRNFKMNITPFGYSNFRCEFIRRKFETGNS